MKLFELFLIAISLAMDAFAVSVCKGLSTHKLTWKNLIIVGTYFGGFQALMPTIGYFFGKYFYNVITNIDHWIIFFILTIIGINMIKEANSNNFEIYDDDLKFKSMIVLAIATSIDALAIGITFVFLDVNFILAISIIGTITFVFSLIGMKIGNKFGNKYERKAELVGGVILICIGLKILLEHLKII